MDALRSGISWRSFHNRDAPDFEAQGEGNDVHQSDVPRTPDNSGRISPNPTLSSVQPSKEPGQPRQHIVHVGGSKPRTRVRGHSSSRSHSHSRPRSRSISHSPHPMHNLDISPKISNHSLHELERPNEPVSCTTSTNPSLSRRPSRNRRAKRNPVVILSKTRFDKFRERKVLGLKRFDPVTVLENSGSVARDHLASERTYLAYVRTSLALASTGVALVQLFTIADMTSRSTGVSLTYASRRIQRFARPLGVTMVLLGLIVLSIAVYRYFLIQHALPKKNFPVARLSIAFISFVLSAAVVVIFGALLGGRVSG